MIVDPTLVRVDGLYALEYEFPPLFVAYLAWGHGALLFAALLVAYKGLIGAVRRMPALLVGAGLFAPVFASLLKALEGYPPGDGFNVTPAFNVMDDGYVLTDATGTVVDANPAARSLVERSP